VIPFDRIPEVAGAVELDPFVSDPDRFLDAIVS